jgi:hypothetical protein
MVPTTTFESVIRIGHPIRSDRQCGSGTSHEDSEIAHPHDGDRLSRLSLLLALSSSLRVSSSILTAIDSLMSKGKADDVSAWDHLVQTTLHSGSVGIDRLGNAEEDVGRSFLGCDLFAAPKSRFVL